MSRRVRGIGVWVTIITLVTTGCQPTQPFFFMEDGDLSHYMDVATDIEYPDVEEPRLVEVDGAQAPLTLDNFDQFDIWDLSLEEATRVALENSQVMRQLGGRLLSNNAPETISRSLIQAGIVTTTYDPALVESGYGTNTGVSQSGTGVESALSEFDANLTGSVIWERNNRPQNVRADSFGGFFVPVFDQELGKFTAEINKFAADGTEFAIRNNTIYDSNNNPTRALPSDWTTNIEASFVHPLLQGRGTQYNRISGPFSSAQFNSGFATAFDGVVIARIRHDMSLADFEGGIRNLVRDVESAYWELYFAYRNLESQKVGQKSALATWKTINELRKVGDRRGAAHEEARARAQYFGFRAQVETMLTELLRAENRLRYILGLSTSDGRLIRPSDQPTTAKINFDWTTSHCEALARRVEIRKQKWNLKKRELELIAARNHMLPRLDAIGQYRWLGLGDKLVDSGGSGLLATEPGSNAFENLTSGEFQEWQLGLQLGMPIGFRRAHAAVRHHQLLLARDRALLQDLELEVSHQLGDAIRDVALHHQLSETHLNQRVSSQEEVRSYTALFEAGSSDPVTSQPVTADVVLNAQRRRFEAEVAYFRALVDYNIAILRVHDRKGSLLDYNGVHLAEGPWPAKAYFDALRRARKRDASTYFDYGFTRPGVISRGPVEQGTAAPGPMEGDVIYEGPAISTVPDMEEREVITTPQPEPVAPENGATLQETPGPVDMTASPDTGTKPIRTVFEAPALRQPVRPADHVSVNGPDAQSAGAADGRSATSGERLVTGSEIHFRTEPTAPRYSVANSGAVGRPATTSGRPDTTSGRPDTTGGGSATRSGGSATGSGGSATRSGRPATGSGGSATMGDFRLSDRNDLRQSVAVARRLRPVTADQATTSNATREAAQDAPNWRRAERQ